MKPLQASHASFPWNPAQANCLSVVTDKLFRHWPAVEGWLFFCLEHHLFIGELSFLCSILFLYLFFVTTRESAYKNNNNNCVKSSFSLCTVTKPMRKQVTHFMSVMLGNTILTGWSENDVFSLPYFIIQPSCESNCVSGCVGHPPSPHHWATRIWRCR